jgi:hypothetical protein
MPRPPRSLLPLAAVLAGAFALTSPPTARAGEAYYLLMFGSQRIPNNPNYSHTFATFVRVRWAGNGPCCAPFVCDAYTISWLPANMKVRVNALCPEPGRNFDLHTTIRWTQCNKMRLSLWGPFPIEKCLYDKALERIAELESGRVRYKANDAGYNSARVTNCIHAISTIVGGRRVRVASPGWGEPASYAILLRMRRWVLDSDNPDYRISSALGLDAYPIIYRDDLAAPRSTALFGPLYRLGGGERGLTPTYGPPGAAAVRAPIPTPLPTAP